ncbi:MAG: N-acetylmuramic acid 6-phosphate etherase [Marinilabiliaceae bacterium]|jgi:N-acetylmuramic acid 6-phosphate etherase|nr:N-acetylmuramic acid 6-phosphate etherase [Marinilabiliaceae bacterium]
MDISTESESNYKNLDTMSSREILESINREDHRVPEVVKTVIPSIDRLVGEILPRMKSGGRLFYLGAGTSGRLGIVDASEIPPTFGLDSGFVIGLIAGGDGAIRKAVEMAEDNPMQGWNDLKNYNISRQDVLVGIAASGRTPYVIGAVKEARKEGIITGCITCNRETELEKAVDIPIVAVTGPEFVTGSTRMKAGTAQKLILNMITTTVMIGLGRVRGNKMVNMQLSNQKLIERGSKMIMDELGFSYEKSRNLLLLHGSVNEVLKAFEK